ncbi:hypothetical protein ABIF83_004398 [Bradyrhizobium ottawaense]
MTAAASCRAPCALGQEPGPLDRIEADIGTHSLLARDSVRPGGELVGPGLDRVDMLAGLNGCESAGPAVIAPMVHRLALPVAVLLAAPDQRGPDHGIAIAVDIGPHLHALTRDPLHREAAGVDCGIDVLDQESAAGCGTFDSLNCLVHGDAIDKKAGARFPCREPTLGTYIESRLCVISSLGNGWRGLRVRAD